jgi:CRP/FNR family cyclic AMP-dependent transcriptional regulator
MENLSEVSGYVASTLVVCTFVAKDMRLLRTIAIFSNLAFIIYGSIEWLPPVLFLHLVLLPLNIVRLAEVVKPTRSASEVSQAGAPLWVPKLWAET